MDEKYKLSQGDQILNQLQRYDDKKLEMLRSRSSESQLSMRYLSQGEIAQSGPKMSRSISSLSTLSQQMKQLPYKEVETQKEFGGDPNFLERKQEGQLKDELVNSQVDLLRLQRSGSKKQDYWTRDLFQTTSRGFQDINDLPKVVDGVKRVEILDDGNGTAGSSHQYTSLKIEDIKPKYVPPINFALVESDLYRSGHPQPVNLKFLEELKLKTIVYLGDKDDNYEYYKWVKKHQISFKFFRMKEVGRAGFRKAADGQEAILKSQEVMNSILNVLLNNDNYPVLIHSNKGKHRVGVLIGLIRVYLQGWTLSGAFDEYAKFSREKGEYDLEFVEMFHPVLKIDTAKTPEFVNIS